ncbi:MAG: SRPBCC domain-containing protein [Prolixibacteraceae bacterium]|jgi:hypothetical protein|nr:SRPBCC domain-containing protein [Prolixibacteraceae bacterium]MBT6007237.1 SRPBCC domain-containing protein [Prolixibacteraceae bacterium]MBT6762943.1 SRPBCC domain-containing protein [Prolixibacteraceae bacterium]MBT7000264.1 SRPBCC domain-containing protein [Prolixibacteraceae bacterium]MBT7395131.1 SRPBCC domain-containing protein [Prolixibacteraceae bacterium]
MREIRTEIQILSKPNKVWETLTNLPAWSDWNPVVNKIEGKLETGSELFITMAGKNGNDGKSYKSVVTEFEEEKRLSFIGIMMAKFMFSAERIIELEDLEEGTLFTQREIYKGLLVSLFWKKLNEQAVRMLNSMNKALKKRVEG